MSLGSLGNKDTVGDQIHKFKDVMLGYSPATHKFLVKDDYQSVMGRSKPEYKSKLVRPVKFMAYDRNAGKNAEKNAQVNEADKAQGQEKVGEQVKWSMLQFRRYIQERSRNIYLSAPAGYGKTDIVKHVVVPELRRRYGARGTWVTASTGIAATSIAGITFHSQSGLQRGYGSASRLIKEMNKSARNRWRHVQAIVIEEISMLSEAFFNLLDEVAKKLKKNDQSFGGIRIFAVGDFCQLSPVGQLRRSSKASEDSPKWERLPVMHAFRAKAWQEAHCLRSVDLGLIDG